MIAGILVPLDGSPLPEAILPEVVDLAKLHHAQVVLLRVALAHALPAVEQTQTQVRAVEEVERCLAEVQRRLVLQDVSVDRVVRYGRAALESSDHVRVGGADRITMSTHGRSGLDPLVMGCTAERVICQGACPVLSIRAAA
jgi:nucleotide-binding universal stress UspA family protein